MFLGNRIEPETHGFQPPEAQFPNSTNVIRPQLSDAGNYGYSGGLRRLSTVLLKPLQLFSRGNLGVPRILIE